MKHAGADCVRNGRRANFGPFANGANANRSVVGDGLLDHVEITLLEDAQRQPAAGKDEGIKRE